MTGWPPRSRQRASRTSSAPTRSPACHQKSRRCSSGRIKYAITVTFCFVPVIADICSRPYAICLKALIERRLCLKDAWCESAARRVDERSAPSLSAPSFQAPAERLADTVTLDRWLTGKIGSSPRSSSSRWGSCPSWAPRAPRRCRPVAGRGGQPDAGHAHGRAQRRWAAAECDACARLTVLDEPG